MSEAPFPVEPAPKRRPRAGYALAVGAAVLWGVNGTVSKVILASGVSSVRLTQVRVTGAFVGFLLVVLLTGPTRLRVRGRELPRLAVFGIAGLAAVQWFYFLAIHRIEIGIALVVQYLAPLLVALWARFVLREPVGRRVWLALALALAGLALVVEPGGGGRVSGTGIAFAFGAALAYAVYLLLAERGVGDRDVVSLLTFGFGFAALAFALAAPWWDFPAHVFTSRTALLGRLAGDSLPVWTLVAWMIVLGTIVPFFLLVSALRHLTATRVGIIAMLEPVVAALVAWVWLDESLQPAQVVGGLVVLAAIVLAQTAR